MSAGRPELLGLLRACKERPEEDGPRLVLSDWLEDSGETTLAALIRLQCQAPRLTVRQRRHQRVDQRVRALELKCAKWLQPLSESEIKISFVRGLLRVNVLLIADFRGPSNLPE
jgi:uncharacterized protein (TIGR02996 family)